MNKHQVNIFKENSNVPEEYRIAPYMSFGEYPKDVLFGMQCDEYLGAWVYNTDCPKEIFNVNYRAVKIDGVWYTA